MVKLVSAACAFSLALVVATVMVALVPAHSVVVKKTTAPGMQIYCVAIGGGVDPTVVNFLDYEQMRLELGVIADTDTGLSPQVPSTDLICNESLSALRNVTVVFTFSVERASGAGQGDYSVRLGGCDGCGLDAFPQLGASDDISPPQINFSIMSPNTDRTVTVTTVFEEVQPARCLGLMVKAETPTSAGHSLLINSGAATFFF